MDVINLDATRLQTGEGQYFFLDNLVIESVQTLVGKAHLSHKVQGSVLRTASCR